MCRLFKRKKYDFKKLHEDKDWIEEVNILGPNKVEVKFKNTNGNDCRYTMARHHPFDDEVMPDFR